MTDELTESLRHQHARALTSTICRYSLAAVVTIVAAIAWRCDPEIRLQRAQTDEDRDYWKGTAGECRRWTP